MRASEAFAMPITSGTRLALEADSPRGVSASQADPSSGGVIAPSPRPELIVTVRCLQEMIAGEISVPARETTSSGEASTTS